MNKMEDVAKLLGLKLGQFFKIDSERYEASIFFLAEDGLHNVDTEEYEFDNLENYEIHCVLAQLLTDTAEITQVVDWKPFEECETYEDKGDR